MNMSEIVIAVVSLCVISAIIGIALSIAEKVFHVEVNGFQAEALQAFAGCGGGSADLLAALFCRPKVEVVALFVVPGVGYSLFGA